MLKELSPSIKSSITRSITKAIEQYMAKIEWNEEKFNINDLIAEWREVIIEASWYVNMDDDTKVNQSFHEELAEKINEVINKMFSEEPTKKQMEEIEELQKQLGLDDIDYSCKAEAKFVIDKLKKKQNS